MWVEIVLSVRANGKLIQKNGWVGIDLVGVAVG
jgi:hypothetical protein